MNLLTLKSFGYLEVNIKHYKKVEIGEGFTLMIPGKLHQKCHSSFWSDDKQWNSDTCDERGLISPRCQQLPSVLSRRELDPGEEPTFALGFMCGHEWVRNNTCSQCGEEKAQMILKGPM